MTFEIVFVLLSLLGMMAALIADKMRPGMVLFSVVVLFLCAGILTPKEMLEGFSNKGMITVALLFLVSEGIRQSGTLGQVIKKLLPQGKTTVFKAQLRILPSVAFISAFLNNTPVVVIFAPIIKHWAKSVKLPATKFLIPLSYVTILGGICTLIGTSTNLVVHGMILEAGYEGFTMFELGKVGIFIAIAGIMGGSLVNAMIALTAVTWTKYARLSRSMVLKIRKRDFVDAAIVSGGTSSHILWIHIMPNVVPILVITAVSDIGAMMMELAGLSFLGFGSQPPAPEWGLMLNEGRQQLQPAPWLMVFPGLAIFISVVIFNLWGDALRDVLDPRDQ